MASLSAPVVLRSFGQRHRSAANEPNTESVSPIPSSGRFVFGLAPLRIPFRRGSAGTRRLTSPARPGSGSRAFRRSRLCRRPGTSSCVLAPQGPTHGQQFRVRIAKSNMKLCDLSRLRTLVATGPSRGEGPSAVAYTARVHTARPRELGYTKRNQTRCHDAGVVGWRAGAQRHVSARLKIPDRLKSSAKKVLSTAWTHTNQVLRR